MLFSGHRETYVPVALYAQLVADEEVLPAFVTGISEHGLHLDSLAILGNRRTDRLQLQLRCRVSPTRCGSALKSYATNLGCCSTTRRFDSSAWPIRIGVRFGGGYACAS